MSIQARGGVPRFLNQSIPAEGARIVFPQLTIWVAIKCSAAAKLFTTKEDMEGALNYFPLALNEVYEAPLEDTGIYVKGDAGAVQVDLALYLRKA